MTPLTPEEREAILALHPDASEDDLDRFEELLVQRFQVEPAPETEPRRGEDAAVAAKGAERAEARAIEREIERMQATVFPRFDAALRHAAERRRGRGRGRGVGRGEV